MENKMKAYNKQFKINKRKCKRKNLKSLKVNTTHPSGSDTRRAIAILGDETLDFRDRCRQAVALGYNP
jgi:hypothetical protein